jgi:hypothetical protein
LGRSYAGIELRDPVNCSRWLVLLCLLGTIAFAVAPLDTPGTAFDEMDRPMFISRAGWPQVKLAAPTLPAGSASDSMGRMYQVPSRLAAIRIAQDQYAVRASDRQNLLCVLLI